MRTAIEWNHDTESIDNNQCKCALGINHKSGRLQWCPGCGYYKIAVLIPIIMMPIIVVFFLLTKLDAIHQIQQHINNGAINGNLNVFHFPDEDISIEFNGRLITSDYDNSIVVSSTVAAIPHNDDYDNDDVNVDTIPKNSQSIINNGPSDLLIEPEDETSLATETTIKCVAVKYGISETADTEERHHILKDVRTSFIPPKFIIIPPKCIGNNENNNNDDEKSTATEGLVEVDVDENDLDDVHDILIRSRRSSLDTNNNQKSILLPVDDDTNGSSSRSINQNKLSIGVSLPNQEITKIHLEASGKLKENHSGSGNKLQQIDPETISIAFQLFWKGVESPTRIRHTQAEIMKSYMDTTVDPCVDFYQYACGNWAKLNPIPKDKAGYDTFEILRESLDIVLRDLLTEIRSKRSTRDVLHKNKKSSVKRKNKKLFQKITQQMNRPRKKSINKRHVYVRTYRTNRPRPRQRRKLSTSRVIRRQTRSKQLMDNEPDAETKAKYLYQSCMNAGVLEKRGVKPLLDLLEKLGGWPVLDQNWDGEQFDWINVTAQLRLYNNDIFIVQWVGPDIKNSDINVMQLDQTSLGLPTRDYFLHESNMKYLDAYKTFMSSIMNLLGASTDNAEKISKNVIEFEIELAKITSSSEERANVSVLYKKMTINELCNQVPDIDWIKYLSIVQQRNVNHTEMIVIYAIDYMKKLVELLSNTNSETVSNYLLWRFVRHRINNLDDRFQESKQKFFNVLFGREESPPRWKNCIGQVNSNMGMAVGAMFVRKYFDENSKRDTLKMTHELQEAFKEILNETDWLDASTKHLAELKVASMSLKIGYPDFILSPRQLNEKYSGLYIDPNKYFENTLNVLRHVAFTEQSKLSEPVNKTIWQTAPAIVNAYYSRNKNQIMFPAGILQPPFYHRYFPRSLNYGGIGVVIGHELTHGFDDKGRLFDKNGNIHKWWSDYAINGFHERAKCLISQYGNYTVSEVGIAVDGESTQGENIADNGGIRQAFYAYENWLNRNEQNHNLIENETLPGLNMTNKQLFFLNFAQVWCGAMRPEATRNKLKTAVHSPGKFRVIGTLSNSDDFSKEFNCPVGSPMNPSHKCSVW